MLYEVAGGVAEVQPSELVLADGRQVPFDECLWTTQASAASWLGETGLPVDTGALRWLSMREVSTLPLDMLLPASLLAQCRCCSVVSLGLPLRRAATCCQSMSAGALDCAGCTGPWAAQAASQLRKFLPLSFSGCRWLPACG